MLRSALAIGLISAPLAVVGLVWPPGASAADPPRGKNQPGWPGVFIDRPNYLATYAKPVVGKGEPPEAYQQTVTYMWLGNRYDEVDVTLARDPAFKDRYAAETLAKEKGPPREREVNKKKAWQWDFPRQAGRLDQVVRRLVVLLDADKAIILEQRGVGSDLEGVAKKFDFAAVEKALATPPRR